MTEPVRFGVVGCGVIGAAHAETIAGLPDAKLVAVADSAEEQARQLGERFHVQAYGDLREMLERERLNVVNVCTPSGMHGKAAMQVMRSGRDVIVEKPMEIRRDAIDEMLAVQKETGTRMAVIFQHRFDPASQQVRRLIDEGALGRIVLGNAHQLWWRSQEYYDSGAWRGTRALDGGGALMNQGIHSIDLLQWLMGPVRSVSAYSDTLAHQMETEDTAVAVVRFASGALGTIVGTTAAYPGVTARLEVFGDRGSAVIADDELEFLHLARDDRDEISAYGLSPQRQGPVAGSGGGSDPAAISLGGHAAQIADMVRAVREDGTPVVDGREGRKAVDIILAIYESARTGSEVFLQ